MILTSVTSIGCNKSSLSSEKISLKVGLMPAVNAAPILLAEEICFIFAENFATSYRIGYFIMNNWIMVNYVDMFVGILALSIVGILLFKAIDWLEHKLCPWIFL